MENPSIKIIGIGEGGARAIGKMISAGVGNCNGISFVTIGKDENILLESTAKENIFLNRDSTTIYKRISAALRGAKIIFIVAGIGGSSATQAIPQVISCAKNFNVATVAFVNRPFVLENSVRKQNAEYCLNALYRDADTIFDIPTEKFFVFRLNQPQVSLTEIFDVANDIFSQGIEIFLDMILKSNSFVTWGNAAFGYGFGANALEAIKTAVKFPLLEQGEIKRAPNIFVRLAGGKDTEAKNFVKSIIKPDSKLFWRNDKSIDGKIFASVVFSRKEV